MRKQHSANDVMIGTIPKVNYDYVDCKQLLLFFIKFHPFAPKSDCKYLISPFNITHKSHIKVTRMKEMITS